MGYPYRAHCLCTGSSTIGVIITLYMLAQAAPVALGFDCFTAVIYQLTTVDCTDKSYRDVPKGLDSKTQVLIFHDNYVASLDAREFQAYEMLQEIYMDRNLISRVYPDAFAGLANLQRLSLEMNKLSTIPSDSFRHIQKVRIVNLRGNQIRSVGADALKYLLHLEQIDLANNYIEHVDPYAFHGLVMLNEINLANNELQTLSADMQLLLPAALHTFRIYDNPWVCDCRLRWLRRWLAGGSNNSSGGGGGASSVAADRSWRFTSNTPSCAGPGRIASVNWMQLNPPQFACAARIVSNSSNPTQVALGGNVSIQCEVYGDPSPHITWKRGARALRANGERIRERTAIDQGIKHIKSVLTLYQVTARDMTDYTCVAENSAGVATMTFKLWAGDVIAPVDGSSSADDVTLFGLHKEIILGVAIAGVVLIMIVLIIMIGVLCQQQDRRKHACKVRETAPGGKDDAGSKTNDRHVKQRSRSPNDRQAYTEQDKATRSESQELIGKHDVTRSNSGQFKPLNGRSESERVDTKTKYIASYDCVQQDVRLESGASGGGGGQRSTAARTVSPPRTGSRSHHDTPDLLKDNGSGQCSEMTTSASRSIPVPPPVAPTHLSNSRRPRAEENPYVKPSELRQHQNQHQPARKTASADDLLDGVNDLHGDVRRGSRSRDDLDEYIQNKPRDNGSHYGTLGQSRYRDHSKTCKNPVCLKDPNLGLAVEENVVEQRKFLKSPPKPLCVHEEVDASVHGYDARGASYRTLPCRPSANAPQHDTTGGGVTQQRHTPSSRHLPQPPGADVSHGAATAAAPRGSALASAQRQPKGSRPGPTKTVSFSEQGHPVVDLTQELPEPIVTPSHRKSPALVRGPGDYSTYSSVGYRGQAPKNISGYSSPVPHVSRGPEHISGVMPSSQRVPGTSTIYGMQVHKAPAAGGGYGTYRSTVPNGSPHHRRQLPRQPYSTTVDELLSPPFGHVPQSRQAGSKTLPHKRNAPRPGEKDEFGTAV